MKYFATIKDVVYEIEIQKDGSVTVNGEAYAVQQQPIDEHSSSLLIDERSLEIVAVAGSDGEYEVVLPGEQHDVLVQDELSYRVAQAQATSQSNSGESNIVSPMPGTIIAVSVALGDNVAEGQTLIVLESMKMENELKAPHEGVVVKVEVEAGDSVQKNKLLMTLSNQ